VNLTDLQGHWRRNWIRASGHEDTTTRVHWLQAGGSCADIRVPLHRPDPGPATCLAEMPPAALAALLAAQGFAGHVTLDADICTWTRERNWRGFPCPVDAGRLWFDDAGLLIEEGVLADYREEWQRVETPALAAFVIGDDGLLLSNAAIFLIALGGRDTPVTDPLAEALRDGTATAGDAAAAFASVYVLGHWEGAAGIADLSTQPFAEGRAVLGRDGLLTLPAFDGRITPRTLPLSPLD
jgi:hypothetical protein